MFPLASHTIFVTLAGSQAHGTARADSDVDLRGVCIAPSSVRLSLFQSFSQFEGELTAELDALIAPRLRQHPTASPRPADKTEVVVFDLAKFVRLCALANPNALEILFADEGDWVHETPAWRRLHRERHHFLTRRVEQTFLGYASAQLKKIETHRAWLLRPPQTQPSRAAFGLPPQGTLSRDHRTRIEQSITRQLRAYGIDELELPQPLRIALQERLLALTSDLLSADADDLEQRTRAVASHALQLPTDVITTLNAEKRYRAAMKHWQSYQAWKAHRNPVRAELERKHGYDTKHAMHLIRLMRMSLEALQAGELRVRRDDAAELAAIRDGSLSYEALIDTARELEGAVRAASETTSLPADIDEPWVDRLVAAMLAPSLRAASAD
ncbi:MAG: nucleotidyltransferase domain-containing protein [Myxococcota bacterium]